jgi:hypothetical protein
VLNWLSTGANLPYFFIMGSGDSSVGIVTAYKQDGDHMGHLPMAPVLSNNNALDLYSGRMWFES